MNRKISLILMTIVALLSLITVGFASWIITDSDLAESSGMIVVDDVIKVNNYITCDTDIKKFKFFKTGFVNEDGTINNIGTIEASLNINIYNCKSKFKDSHTLEIDLSLESENLNVFLESENLVITVTIMNGSTPIKTSSFDNDENTVLLTIFDIEDFHNLPDKLTLNVVYTFEIRDTDVMSGKDYFSKTVYPILIRNSFNFVLSAKLTGKVGTN